ncbi:MAG: macro domain-containing protein [Clostridia bacterium]
MPMEIVRNDITKIQVDAIVNAANASLKMGSGVCGAIFSAAGEADLQKECEQLGICHVGQAVITSGYALPAKYVIHTVGPIWQGGVAGEAQALANCYSNSLELALRYKCNSIAFPLISSGVFGYPKDEALKIAIASIGEFLLRNELLVYLVVYDNKAYQLSAKLFSAIENYIDDNYIEEHQRNQRISQVVINNYMEMQEFLLEDTIYEQCAPATKKQRSLHEVVAQLEESFSQMLLRLIDEKQLTDVATYKKANIDRKLFSKIRSDNAYNPKKTTAIAFAIALELSLDETKDLLARAGYTLSHSHKFDLIVEYFIAAENYNIFEINEALFAFDQLLLGA